MNIIDELKKLGVEPYDLTREEFEQHYTNLYNVLALAPEDLYYAAHDIILMFQLRQIQRAAIAKAEGGEG